MRASPLFLSTLIACSSAGSGDRSERGPDAAPPPGDAAPRSDAEPPSDARREATDVIGPWGGEANLRIAASREFPEGSCYPQPGFDAVIIMLEVDGASAGETVTFSAAGGGNAYFCPSDQQQPCEPIEEGSVEFETYQEGTGAVGTYNLAGGLYKSAFDASWCISD